MSPLAEKATLVRALAPADAVWQAGSMEEGATEIPINGVLDLHTFHPREVAAVVDAYIEACREQGIRDLRLIHGKGIGTLRETVHARLRQDPRVASFQLGGAGGGDWGATVVRLK